MPSNARRMRPRNSAVVAVVEPEPQARRAWPE
jgi:hypothetical protein